MKKFVRAKRALSFRAGRNFAWARLIERKNSLRTQRRSGIRNYSSIADFISGLPNLPNLSTVSTVIPVFGAIFGPQVTKIFSNRAYLRELIRSGNEKELGEITQRQEIIRSMLSLKQEAYHLKNAGVKNDSYLSRIGKIDSQINERVFKLMAIRSQIDATERSVANSHRVKKFDRKEGRIRGRFYFYYNDLFIRLDEIDTNFLNHIIFWNLSKMLNKAYDHWLQERYADCSILCDIVEKEYKFYQAKHCFKDSLDYLRITLSELKGSTLYFQGIKDKEKQEEFLQSSHDVFVKCLNKSNITKLRAKEVLNNLAYLYMTTGNFEDAEKVFAYLNLHYPTSLVFLRNRAELFNHIGKFDDAIDCIESAINLDPEDILLKHLKLEILINNDESISSTEFISSSNFYEKLRGMYDKKQMEAFSALNFCLEYLKIKYGTKDTGRDNSVYLELLKKSEEVRHPNSPLYHLTKAEIALMCSEHKLCSGSLSEICENFEYRVYKGCIYFSKFEKISSTLREKIDSKSIDGFSEYKGEKVKLINSLKNIPKCGEVKIISPGVMINDLENKQKINYRYFLRANANEETDINDQFEFDSVFKEEKIFSDVSMKEKFTPSNSESSSLEK